jgi:hypothetical protein
MSEFLSLLLIAAILFNLFLLGRHRLRHGYVALCCFEILVDVVNAFSLSKRLLAKVLMFWI